MFHTTYLIINEKTGEYYIGKHSTNNLDDGYMGSGSWPNQMVKEGIELKKYYIGVDYKTSEDSYTAEKEILGDKWKTDKLCKNMKPGGETSFFEKEVYSEYCMSMYGVSHHMKSEKFKESFNFPFKDPEIQKKVSETLSKIYGGRGSASQIIKEKFERTNIERYGEKHTLNSDKVKTARENKILEIYGCSNPFNNPDKLAEVLKSKYGVSNMMKVPEIRAKHKKSMEEKDWTERNEKSRETNLKKYGVTVAANLPEVK
jgi:hypothetical protein